MYQILNKKISFYSTS